MAKAASSQPDRAWAHPGGVRMVLRTAPDVVTEYAGSSLWRTRAPRGSTGTSRSSTGFASTQRQDRSKARNNWRLLVPRALEVGDYRLGDLPRRTRCGWSPTGTSATTFSLSNEMIVTRSLPLIDIQHVLPGPSTAQ